MRRDDNRDEDTDLNVEGPIGDAELPIMEHLLVLRSRLINVLIPFGIATLIGFFFSSKALRYLLFHNLFHEEIAMFVYSPMEWMSVRLLFSFMFALSVTIPLLVYEIFAFIQPGLYPSERKFFMMVTIPSLFSYAVGALFAYLFVLPAIFDYLITYSGDIAQVSLSAKRVISIIFYTAVGFGLIFQIPFIMTLAVKMKLITYSWLRDKRLIIYGLILGITLFLIPDPTGIAMIIAVASIALFELGLLLTKYIEHKHT